MLNSEQKYIIVPEDKTFIFSKLCPYCKGNLTYTCNSWIEDENGLWMADDLNAQCSNEPHIESDDWDQWYSEHIILPYVRQLPVDNAVKDLINKKYRFQI